MKDKDYPTAGSDLYRVISDKIDVEDKIDLDLEGVSLIPSMFLNVSIGKIIKERGLDFMKSKITFSNIKSSDAKRIKEYVGRFA